MSISSALSSNNLPAEYTELEYIESTGTQYIDTGVSVSDSNEIEFTVDYSALQTLYGCANSSWATNSAVFKGSHIRFLLTNKMYNYSGTGLHTFIVNSNNITIDGNVYEWDTDSGNTATGNLNIFRGYTANNLIYGAFKLYSFKITNNTLVRNFIPAKRNNDGLVGMYDTVTKTFFTNAGTGTFIAGPAVVIQIATTKYVEDAFADSVTELNTAISTVKTVVDNTIIQADRIGKLYTGKQTRPTDTCPDGAQCLLITEADGSLHWYPICNADGTVGFNVSAFIAGISTTGIWGDEYYADSQQYPFTSYSSWIINSGGDDVDIEEVDIELEVMGWAIEKNNYGRIYGRSVCSNKTGKYGDVYNGELTDAGKVNGGGGQCWCKMVGVKGTNSQKVDTSNTPWVFYQSMPWGGSGQMSPCYGACAYECANAVYEDATFRVKILGTSN